MHEEQISHTDKLDHCPSFKRSRLDVFRDAVRLYPKALPECFTPTCSVQLIIEVLLDSWGAHL